MRNFAQHPFHARRRALRCLVRFSHFVFTCISMENTLSSTRCIQEINQNQSYLVIKGSFI